MVKGGKVKLLVSEEVPDESVHEIARLSEQALANEWSRPEEDEAWSYLHSEP